MLLPGQTIESVLAISRYGLALDADALPIGSVFRNTSLTSIPVTVQSIASTGMYSYSFVLPTNYVDGDNISISFTYLIGGEGPFVELAKLGIVDQSSASFAYGQFRVDYATSRAYQYNLQGDIIATFALQDSAGNPATSANTATNRVPL